MRVDHLFAVWHSPKDCESAILRRDQRDGIPLVMGELSG